MGIVVVDRLIRAKDACAEHIAFHIIDGPSVATKLNEIQNAKRIDDNKLCGSLVLTHLIPCK